LPKTVIEWVKVETMRVPNNSKLDYNRVKYSGTRDGKIRFDKIRQGNEMRRGKIRKKQVSEMYNRRDKL
jgi:hypothetical protein